MGDKKYLRAQRARSISRREAISTAGKVAVGVVLAGFAAGVGGYYAGTATAPAREVTTTVRETVTTTVKAPETPRKVTFGMVLGGFIKGSTWDGRQIIAVERLKQLYPWFDSVYDEGVILQGKDPLAATRDIIRTYGASVVWGSWEPVAIPGFNTLADEFPDVYFLGNIGSDISSRRNHVRGFVRQYQAMYLEGIVAGSITQTNKVGIAVGPLVVQNLRRMAAFYLGIKEANPDATLFVKYVGEWFDPPKERDVSHALIDLGVDVLTNYTDSTEPVAVAAERGIWYVGKDTDIVGLPQYKWATTDTVAVSFDTRWEVLFDTVLRYYLSGNRHPPSLVFVGMRDFIPLSSDNPWVPGQTRLPAVDLQNDLKVGIDAISPKARRLIPEENLKLIERRRESMMLGSWDPFYEYPLISGGEGIPIPELKLDVPPKGTVVKPAGVMPSDEFLLGKLNFHLDGIRIVK